MAANRTMLMAGWGIQRQQYGEQKHWMLVTLAAMLGQIGTPGGGFGFSYHYSIGGNPTRVGGVLPEMSAAIAGQASGAADDGGMRAIPVARIVDALENPGGKYQHNGMLGNIRNPVFRRIADIYSKLLCCLCINIVITYTVTHKKL